MCTWGTTTVLMLPRADGRLGPEAIDLCIAPLVAALNAGGVRMVASCCGHGMCRGNIALADGRMLDIIPDYKTWKREEYARETVTIHGEPLDKPVKV